MNTSRQCYLCVSESQPPLQMINLKQMYQFINEQNELQKIIERITSIPIIQIYFQQKYIGKLTYFMIKIIKNQKHKFERIISTLQMHFNRLYNFLQQQKLSMHSCLARQLKKLCPNIFNSENNSAYYQQDEKLRKALQECKSRATLTEIETANQILSLIEKKKCLGCIQYIQKKIFLHTKQTYSFVDFRLFQNLLQDSVKKKVCSLLNSGGGYIFIANFIGQTIESISLENKDKEIQYKKNVQNIIKRSIFPNTFHLQIDNLPLKQHKKTKIKNEPGFVLRVIVRPFNISNIFFIVKQVPGFKPTFESTFLNVQNMGLNDDVTVLADPGYIYDLIVKKLKYSRNFCQQEDSSNSHWRCINPDNVLPKLINKYKQLNNKKPLFLLLKDQQPEPKYRNHSVLILNSAADEQIIHMLTKQMQKSKVQKFFCCKPYESFRSNSIRPMWFLSHQRTLQQIKQIISSLAPQKSKTYALITCTKYLYVEKRDEEWLQKFKKIFSYMFNHDFQMKKKPKQNSETNLQLYDFYIKFGTYNQSFFSFIFLDDMRVRSQFSKQNKYKQII